jgi:hypothetical protein
MSQYQPPQGGPPPQPSPFPQQPAPAPQGFGQQSQAPQGFGPQGYPEQSFQQGPVEPGLFDTSFARPTTLKVAKPAYVAVIVLAASLVVYGLVQAIASFALGGVSGDASYVLVGIGQLVFLPAAGFAVLTLGRLTIEYFVETHKARERAAAGKH